VSRIESLIEAARKLPEDAYVNVPVRWLRELDGLNTEHMVDLTVRELAALLGRAESTVRSWCGQGRLRGAYRLQGREWRIPSECLRDLRECSERSPTMDENPIDLGAWRREGNR
jgi:excisionase family DNA binding protein